MVHFNYATFGDRNFSANEIRCYLGYKGIWRENETLKFPQAPVNEKMLGEKALELIRELQRSIDGSLTPYNVRLIEEANAFPSERTLS